jgi:hypothetical protein
MLIKMEARVRTWRLRHMVAHGSDFWELSITGGPAQATTRYARVTHSTCSNTDTLEKNEDSDFATDLAPPSAGRAK